MKPYLKQLELGPLQNFIYLIGSSQTPDVAVVDPGWDVPAILDAAARDEKRITHILITHTHFDHINGVAELLRATDAQVLVHKKEAEALPIEKSNIQPVEGGDEILVGGLALTFLHTPGHTPGSLCMTAADHLIAGDTLFVGGCGRCDLPGSDPEALHKSLTRLSHLDEQFVLYPGHNYATHPSSSMQEEKSRNPFLRAESLDQFLGLIGQVRRGS